MKSKEEKYEKDYVSIGRIGCFCLIVEHCPGGLRKRLPRYVEYLPEALFRLIVSRQLLPGISWLQVKMREPKL